MLLWKKYNAFSLILCDGHQRAWICIHNPSRLSIIIQSYKLSINKLVVYFKITNCVNRNAQTLKEVEVDFITMTEKKIKNIQELYFSLPVTLECHRYIKYLKNLRWTLQLQILLALPLKLSIIFTIEPYSRSHFYI